MPPITDHTIGGHKNDSITFNNNNEYKVTEIERYNKRTEKRKDVYDTASITHLALFWSVPRWFGIY